MRGWRWRVQTGTCFHISSIISSFRWSFVSTWLLKISLELLLRCYSSVLACNHTAPLITIHCPYFLSYRKSNSPTTTNRKFAICKKLSNPCKTLFCPLSLAAYSIYLQFLDGNYASLAPTVKLWELTVPNTFRAPVPPSPRPLQRCSVFWKVALNLLLW